MKPRLIARCTKLLPIACLAAMCVALFWPALFMGKSMGHGDAVAHGLPMLEYHARALSGEGSLLWSDKVYGGHALLAETQSAFLHPLNLLLDTFVQPRYGHGLFHFLCLLIGAIGTYRLGRTLGIGRWGAAIAGLAVTFSTAWLVSYANMTISGTLAWIPWCVWSFERWYRRPTLIHTLTLAGMAALVVLAGYIQLAHGLAIYIVVSLLPMLFIGSERLYVRDHWRHLLGYGLLAVSLAAGICAAQLLPLLELIPVSGRSDGTALLFPGFLSAYVNGALLSPMLDKVVSVASLGSPLIALMFMVALALRLPSRIIGHALAAALLLALGMSTASPVFNFVYAHNLVPGIGYFRIMQAYLALGLIPLAIVAVSFIDRLSHAENPRRDVAALWKAFVAHPVRAPLLIIACVAWATGMMLAYRNAPGSTGYLAAILALGTVVALACSNRLKFLPMSVFALLLLECLMLRFGTFRMIDKSALEKPRTVQIIQTDPDYRSYKVYDHAESAMFVFTKPDSTELGNNMRKMIVSIGGMTNLLWDIPSLDGSMALYTARSQVAKAAIRQELESSTNGQRLLDILSVRYVTTYARGAAAGLEALYEDNNYGIILMRNRRALPALQLYEDHVGVTDAKQAVEAIHASNKSILAVEGVSGSVVNTIGTGGHVCGSKDGAVATKIRPLRTAVSVTTARPCWLFIADAPYPSWRARINGEEVPVYTAQVLGRAVRLPVGESRVVMEFDTSLARLGAGISILSLAVIAIIVLLAWARNRQKKAPRRPRPAA